MKLDEKILLIGEDIVRDPEASENIGDYTDRLAEKFGPVFEAIRDELIPKLKPKQIIQLRSNLEYREGDFNRKGVFGAKRSVAIRQLPAIYQRHEDDLNGKGTGNQHPDYETPNMYHGMIFAIADLREKVDEKFPGALDNIKFE